MSNKQHKISAVHFLSDIKGFCQKFKERLASVRDKKVVSIYIDIK